MVFKKGEKSKNWSGFKKGYTSWLKGTKGLVKSPLKGKTKKNGKYPEHVGFQKSNKFGRTKKTWNKGLPKEKQPHYGKTFSKKTREKMRLFKVGKYGDKSSNWKGGISIISKLVRNMLEYFIWRSRVFERDNWTCQTCRNRGVYLEAHHKEELNNILKYFNIKNIDEARKCSKLWDIGNGVALCKDCHNLTKKGRKKKNVV